MPCLATLLVPAAPVSAREPLYCRLCAYVGVLHAVCVRVLCVCCASGVGCCAAGGLWLQAHPVGVLRQAWCALLGGRPGVSAAVAAANIKASATLRHQTAPVT